jgi:hypothetical protein
LDPPREQEDLTFLFSLSCSIPSQEKKLGKKADMTEFRAQLDSLGLKIVEVNADGNCFFRFRTNSTHCASPCRLEKKRPLDFERNASAPF